MTVELLYPARTFFSAASLKTKDEKGETNESVGRVLRFARMQRTYSRAPGHFRSGIHTSDWWDICIGTFLIETIYVHNMHIHISISCTGFPSIGSKEEIINISSE